MPLARFNSAQASVGGSGIGYLAPPLFPDVKAHSSVSRPTPRTLRQPVLVGGADPL